MTPTAARQASCESNLQQECKGASSCSLEAVVALAEDPCYGTYKWAEVRYTCTV